MTEPEPSFELHPDRFVAGTVGPPGERVFYLQATEGGNVVSLRLEKQQVAALAEYLAGILADLPAPEELVVSDTELVEPVIAEWVVGSLAVAYEESEDRVLIVAEELVPDDEEDEDAAALDARSVRPPDFHVTRAQVALFRAARHRGRDGGSAGLPPLRSADGPRRTCLPEEQRAPHVTEPSPPDQRRLLERG